MGQPAGRVARGEAVENTTGLPPAKRRRAEDFERWCLFHSWGMCAGCGMMAPRDLTEHTLTKDQKVTQAAGSCWRCKAARHYPALSVADAPEAQRCCAVCPWKRRRPCRPWRSMWARWCALSISRATGSTPP